MKKSIRIIIYIIVIILFLVVVYLQVIKKNHSSSEEIKKDYSILEQNKKVSHLSVTGETDYQYYYGYDYSFGCDYYSKDNLIYHMLKGIEQAPVIKEMPMADKETLKVLDFLYAKDKNYAYYLGSKIDNADGETFEVIYSGDSNGCHTEDDIINTATGFAKDKNNVYQYNKIIDNLDSFSFEYLENRYIKTKNGIFINDYPKIEQIEEADTQTFKTVKFEDSPSYVNSEYDAMDKNYKYKNGKIID